MFEDIFKDEKKYVDNRTQESVTNALLLSIAQKKSVSGNVNISDAVGKIFRVYNENHVLRYNINNAVEEILKIFPTPLKAVVETKDGQVYDPAVGQ